MDLTAYLAENNGDPIGTSTLRPGFACRRLQGRSPVLRLP